MPVIEPHELASFLSKCSTVSLGDFLLSRLNRVANCRRLFAEAAGDLFENMVHAQLARILRGGEGVIGNEPMGALDAATVAGLVPQGWQWSRHQLDARARKLSPYAYVMWGAISSFANREGYCWAAMPTMMATTSIRKRNTAYSAVTELLEEGIVFRRRLNKGGRLTLALYRLGRPIHELPGQLQVRGFRLAAPPRCTGKRYNGDVLANGTTCDVPANGTKNYPSTPELFEGGGRGQALTAAAGAEAPPPLPPKSTPPVYEKSKTERHTDSRHKSADLYVGKGPELTEAERAAAQERIRQKREGKIQ